MSLIFWTPIQSLLTSAPTFSTGYLLEIRLLTLAATNFAYFLTVNGTEKPVFSHDMFSTPPPDGLLSMAIVNWSTVLSSETFFRSIRASSFVASLLSLYGIPHWPVFLLTISLAEPSAAG